VRDEDGNILIYSANDRGDRGNVGIIRSPVRASLLTITVITFFTLKRPATLIRVGKAFGLPSLRTPSR